jgi:hypothetical protein
VQKLMRRRPSPAMVVAFVALVAALGGSAVALPGKNKVDKNDIKKNAVGAKQIKTGAVAGSEAKNDSLTGADVDESSLAKVPSAAAADSATTATTATNAGTVGGVQVFSATAQVEIPTFGAGNNQCNTASVAVPGVQRGDVVTATPTTQASGNDQVMVTVKEISVANAVRMQGCISADATTPHDPQSEEYRFVWFR